MEVCIGEVRGKPVMLEVRDGVVSIDGVAEPIKNLTEDDLKQFQESLDALPRDDAEGNRALVNARRAAFLSSLLGKAVGDECVGKLTDILDHVHYEVLKYLGETGEET
ncbi:MAG: hypothetical protein HDQ89_03365 [Desulfovibrio sp.]|nr:hypothetical protein [Desulfovibrio sp.]